MVAGGHRLKLSFLRRITNSIAKQGESRPLLSDPSFTPSELRCALAEAGVLGLNGGPARDRLHRVAPHEAHVYRVHDSGQSPRVRHP